MPKDEMKEVAESLTGWMFDTRRWLSEMHTTVIDSEAVNANIVSLLSQILDQLKQNNEKLDDLKRTLERR